MREQTQRDARNDQCMARALETNRWTLPGGLWKRVLPQRVKLSTGEWLAVNPVAPTATTYVQPIVCTNGRKDLFKENDRYYYCSCQWFIAQY